MIASLAAANYPQAEQYWEGGHYELNLSFDSLRDKQWQRAIQILWGHTALNGPLASRYSPNEAPPPSAAVVVPPPTATLTQHGQIAIDHFIVGCDVQATRSLFECISVLVPLNMFVGIVGDPLVRKQHSELSALDAVFYDIALTVYDAAPFKIAAIGYERECQLLAELHSDAQQRHNFLVTGNFLAHEDVLRAIEPDLTPYQEVRPSLYWLGPQL